ncbi:MAG: hypothetical protein AAF682_28965 [Planctomycetota bacterium]
MKTPLTILALAVTPALIPQATAPAVSKVPLPQRNLLGNGGFESWSLGHVPGGPLGPDLWYTAGDPTLAFDQTDMQFTRVPEQAALAADSCFAMKLVPSTPGSYVAQTLESGCQLAGRWITFSADFRPEPGFVVAKPAVEIHDGIGQSQSCEVIFGADGWSRLTVRHLVDSAATTVELRLIPGGIVEVNDAMAIAGSLASAAYVPHRNPEPVLSELPLGSIIGWFRFDPSIPIPEGFALCDGAPIADPKSPFFGKATVDLRDRFVRGVADVEAIGEVGGSQAVNLSHGHGMHHTHDGQTGYPDSVGYDFWIDWQGWGKPALDNHRHTFTTGGPSKSTTDNALGDVSIVPPYVGLLKLLRIR